MVASFTGTLARRLLAWALGSVVLGVALLVAADGFWRGFGLQAGLWGLIDSVIALVALRSARAEAGAAHPGGGSADLAAHEIARSRRIARILWLNTGLDVVYVAVGAALVAVAGSTDPFLAGNGWGVIVQGGFLLVFDLVHALRVPTPDGPVTDRVRQPPG